MTASHFSQKIISWYQQNKRDLPWRNTHDPYKVWLSEIILQQTRVAQGLPYYVKFLKAFPTVKAMARANEQDVLRLWQGLGYYTRARNLHKCAKEVVEKREGKFPNTYQDLITLPGVGPYTAAAIASFCFREPVAVVDGNVFRVLARVFGISEDIATPEGKKVFTAKANTLISQTTPDLFNQAMMEFGATHCTPKLPACHSCIFSTACVAQKQNLQNLLPVKTKKAASRQRYLYYFIIGDQKKVAMQKRQEKDIWHGLYDFVLIESAKPMNEKTMIAKNPWLNLFSITETIGPIKHVLSHQKLFASFINLTATDKRARKTLEKKFRLTFFTKKQIEQLPKPILIDRFIEKYGLPH